MGIPSARRGLPIYDGGLRQVFDFETDILDYPFWRASTEYDGNLAVMSLAMALSASRIPAQMDEQMDSALNLESFLTDAGFTNLRLDDYSKVTSMYTVATAMGQRRMEAEGEEPFTLIAIGVCGSGYQNEWQSNMSPGQGGIHEGFREAAGLVVDRLAGYIATQGIEGPVKVWISGFSRAAAFSNLAAAELTDTGMLPKENVYAYTFATPAAVIAPPETSYEHIFNIICPTDLVPQVMPSDWGFGRYGQDMFLPVPEFSSFFGAEMTNLREELDRRVFGVDNNYSPELNLRMRLLISLVLDVVDNQAYYDKIIQPALVGIMQDRSIPNLLTTLRSLMEEKIGSTKSQIKDVDELMDYFLRVFSGSMTRSGLGAANNNNVSPMMRLFNEHYINSYLANMDAIRNRLFEPSTSAYYVMVRGPVTVSIFFEGEQDGWLVSMDASGQKTYASFLSDNALQDAFYMERCNQTTVLAVPADLDYRVEWTAESGGTVECLQTLVSVHDSARYDCGVSEKIQTRPGDSGIALRQADGRNMLPDGFTETTYDARKLAEFMGIASLGVNWRYALMALCAVIALVICVCLCFAAAHQMETKKRFRFLSWLCLCVLGIAALETEAAYWFFADRPLIRVFWKGVVAACLLLLFFQTHPAKGRLVKTYFPVLALMLAGDLVITVHFVSGAVLFLLAHAVLIFRFLRQRPLSLGKWVVWLVLSLSRAAVIVLFYAPSYGWMAWGAAVYTAVILLTILTASGQPFRTRVSVFMFAASDFLLILYSVLLHDPLIHALYMGLFYIALLSLAMGDESRAYESSPSLTGASEALT